MPPAYGSDATTPAPSPPRFSTPRHGSLTDFDRWESPSISSVDAPLCTKPHHYRFCPHGPTLPLRARSYSSFSSYSSSPRTTPLSGYIRAHCGAPIHIMRKTYSRLSRRRTRLLKQPCFSSPYSRDIARPGATFFRVLLPASPPQLRALRPFAPRTTQIFEVSCRAGCGAPTPAFLSEKGACPNLSCV
jgi:hypothetical protein